MKPVSYTHLDVYKRQVIHLRHTDAILCQFIQHRCMNLTTETAKIGEAQIVCQYDNNIRFEMCIRDRPHSILGQSAFPNHIPDGRNYQSEPLLRLYSYTPSSSYSDSRYVP